MNQSFKDKCKEFILLLKDRGFSKDLRKYNFDKWYDSAFSTVARSLGKIFEPKSSGRYEKWHREFYDKLKNEISALLKRLSPNGTLNVSVELDRIASACGVPFGIVQKIFGIMLKYIITNYYGDDGEFDSQKVAEEFPWVKDEDFVKTLHIPIDAYVLKSLKKEGSIIDIKFYVNKKTGNVSASINGRAWSKMYKKDWLVVQAEVQRLAEENGMLPFEYEMKVLWNPQNDN